MNLTNKKKLIIPIIYLSAIGLITGSIIWLVSAVNKYLSVPKDYNYSINGLLNESIIPVVNESSSIIRPYLSDKVTIGKYFYDFEADATNQEKSLIFFENTYMQNSGVDYISDEAFDVVSVMDGEVIKVESDKILGTIVEIKHDQDFVTVYQGVENVTLAAGEKVNQGVIVGTSGISKINTSYPSSLHFEVYYKGKLIDPENFYSINIEDL